MFYVYILYCDSIDRYYVGHSNDVSRRLAEHNNPRRTNKYTAKSKGWKLVLSIDAGESRTEAVRMERYIKRQKSRKYIDSLIKAANNPELIAQLVRVPTCRD